MNDPILLLGISTSALELISFVLAAITVILNIRQTHWAWLFAIASSAMYAFVFHRAQLFGDMGLQGVFIVVSGWGWYQWLHGGVAKTALVVTRASATETAFRVAGWLAGFAMLAYFLDNYTPTDVPYIDGFLTAGSLVGQILLSRKKVENWVVWIIVDILYVWLYLYKDLVLTAILYGVFIVLAAIGLYTWQRDAKMSAKVNTMAQPA